MKYLKFELPLIGDIEITIEKDELAEFTKRQLSSYLKDIKNLEQGKNSITIKSSDFLQKIKPFFEENKTLARQVKIADNQLKYQDFYYNFSSDKLEITFDLPKKKIKWYKKWYKKEKPWDYPYCHIMFYNKILFPIFSLYSMFEGYYLIHGSLLEFNNKNIILSGLDGVGKSSLSNILVENGAKLYSDNFVLFNGEKSIPFNMAIRLEPNQQTIMKEQYIDSDLKEVVSPDVLNEPIVPEKCYLLTIGENKIEKYNSTNNTVQLALFTNKAPEIQNANNFISPFLYNSLLNTQNINNLKVEILSIPKGKLQEGFEVLKNDN